MDSTMHPNQGRPLMGGNQEVSGDSDSYAPYSYYQVTAPPSTIHDHPSYSRYLADHSEARAEIANDNSNPFDLYESPVPHQHFSLASSGYPLKSNRSGNSGSIHRIAHVNQDSNQRPENKFAYVRTDKGKLTWGPVAALRGHLRQNLDGIK